MKKIETFKKNRMCPKCGGKDIHAGFHRANGNDCEYGDPCYWNLNGKEHIGRYCRGCSYKWTEWTKDRKTRTHGAGRKA
jgi:hypothetical protein